MTMIVCHLGRSRLPLEKETVQGGSCRQWAMNEGPARSSTPFEVSNRIRELERQLQEEKGKRCY